MPAEADRCLFALSDEQLERFYIALIPADGGVASVVRFGEEAFVRVVRVLALGGGVCAGARGGDAFESDSNDYTSYKSYLSQSL